MIGGKEENAIYEYECRKCKERFEVLQKMNEDNSHLRCPKCQAERPQRVLSLLAQALSNLLTDVQPDPPEQSTKGPCTS